MSFLELIKAKFRKIQSGTSPLFVPKIDSKCDAEISVRSTMGDETYLVNCARIHCTCEDFKKRRASYSPEDPRRVCKHIFRQFEKSNLEQLFDDLTWALLKSGKNSGRILVAELESGVRFAVSRVPGSDWVNVITRTRRKGEKGGHFSGPYGEFGFSVSENRWSYGSGPPAAAEIRQALQRLL